MDQYEKTNSREGTVSSDKEFKYKDALKLFEEIYFTWNGDLRTSAWDDINPSPDIKDYYEITKHRTTYSINKTNKIVGKNAFSPRIRRVPVQREENVSEGITAKYRYLLSIDNQELLSIDSEAFLKKNPDITEIDITGMKSEEVSSIVKEMLEMSNEDIMKKFNIYKTYDKTAKVTLILDDMIQKYFEENNIKIKNITYRPDSSTNIHTILGSIHQQYVYDNNNESVIAMSILEDEKIFCKLLTGDNLNKEGVVVSVSKKLPEPQSEIGKKMLQTIQERFSEEPVLETGNEQNRKEELISNIIKAQEEGKDLDDKLKEANAKTTDNR